MGARYPPCPWPLGFYEALIAALIVAIILVPQLVGTETVSDPSQGLNEEGCPVASTTLEDLEASGTRFGCLTYKEWEDEIRHRFPKGEIRQMERFANTMPWPTATPAWRRARSTMRGLVERVLSAYLPAFESLQAAVLARYANELADIA